MKVFPIMSDKTDENGRLMDLQMVTPNKEMGEVALFGWEPEDGVIFYTEDIPKFHPVHGQPLEYEKESEAVSDRAQV
jgi:hypothetical protein